MREKTPRLSCNMEVGLHSKFEILDDQLIFINRCRVWEQLEPACNTAETEWRKGSCSGHQR